MHRDEACTLQSVMRLQLRAHARSFVRVWVNWQPKSLRGNVLRAQQTVTQTQGNTNYSRLPAKFAILQLHKAILVHVLALCCMVWQPFCFEDKVSSRRQSTSVPGAQIETYWLILLLEMMWFESSSGHFWLNVFTTIHYDLMWFSFPYLGFQCG